MKKRLLFTLIAVILFLMPEINFGQPFVPQANATQSPNLGTAATFAIYTTIGAVSNTGISQITGNVGSNSGSSTAFGNVNGNMCDGGPVSAQCAIDLLACYNLLSSAVPDYSPAPFLGDGQILTTGVYSLTGATVLDLDLTLDAENNPSAIFIFKISGPLSTNANSKVKLINGAMACNVYWKVEGLVDMATGTTMRGTVIANNAAINMNAGDTLEGRALSISGAITVNGVFVYTPIGCGSPVLNGPAAPALASIACFTLFSANGPVTNVGVTNVTGDVGTNYGLTTGFDPLTIIGSMHPIPDVATIPAASDLLNINTYLDNLPYDILLMHPEQFGRNLVLTPHTYRMNAAVTFTDTVYLNAQGVTDAVFVIQVNGDFGTSTHSKVILINGTQAKNVFWKINGAVSINNYSIFNGTIVANNGAISLTTGVTLNGRALTTTGALLTSAITAVMTPGCSISSAPVLGLQPINQTVCAGSPVSFSVIATGTSLTYQWRKGTVNLVNGTNISGATLATLTIASASLTDVVANYNVVVTGTVSPAVTSSNVSLAVNSLPSITTQPTAQIICPGAAVNFSVVAAGTGLTYQWKKAGVSIINSTNITGATTANLTINAASVSDAATNYTVVVSGTCLPVATSSNTTLVVNPIPNITTQPTNQTVCSGSPVNFSVVATGAGLTYQWKNGGVNVINSTNITGATSANLTFNAAGITDASTTYTVVVSGTCLPIATSTNTILAVNSLPSITTQPTNQTVCSGSPVNFSVVATGAGLTYQWKNGGVNVINSTNITGATSANLTFNAAGITDASTTYTVVVSGTCLPIATSATTTLVVNSASSITTQPMIQTVCSGTSANLSVVATGTGLTYQWKKGTVNLVNGTNIVGATSANLTINAATITDAGTDYSVVVSGTCLPVATSTNTTLVVNSAPSIATQSAIQTVCSGTSVNFSVVATGTGLTYQWKKGTVNLINGTNILGATSANLTINAATITDAGSDYSVVVSGTCLPIATSTNTILVVNSAPSITTQSTIQTVCSGTSVNFSVVATGTGLTYQWKKGTVNLVNGTNILGATSANLTINAASVSDASSNFNVVVSGTCMPIATSLNNTLIVNSSPSIITHPVSQTVIAGNSVSFTVIATGAGLTYQWKKGTVNLSNTGNVTGATTATLTLNPAAITDPSTNYNVAVSGTCSPVVFSLNAVLVVNSPPSITVQPASQNVIIGSSVSFSVQATGTNLTYQWRKDTVNISNAWNVTGANSSTLTIDPVNFADLSSNYTVVIGGMLAPNDTSNNVALGVTATSINTVAPNMGAAADFVLFSTIGAVSNTGTSYITGNVGTNSGGSTAFGNVNGGMHDGDPISILCAANLLTAYNFLNASNPTFFHAPMLGNGETLISGVYSIDGATTLSSYLYLDGKGNANSVFIIKISGPLSSTVGAKVILLNGALACNVFWKVEGAVTLATGTIMRGTIVANNAAIVLNSGVILEGRALSTTGAVTVHGVLASTPIGCGSPYLTGPTAPSLGTAACFAVFSTDGAVINTGVTNVTGSVGSNNGSANGFDPLLVAGSIHPTPDSYTAKCAADLLTAYNYLNLLANDIELLYPVQFGRNLVLTPHTYIMKAATTFTDTLYLNGQGNPNAVFVIKINGALTTSTYSKVILVNGTQAKNVYWMINGAVNINDYSIFNGTIICNNGAISLTTGVLINGRALTTTGAVSIAASTITGSNCENFGVSGINEIEANVSVKIYPNPFNSYVNVSVNNFAQIKNCKLTIYNILGKALISTTLTKEITTFETNNLPAGIYFYKVVNNDKTIQSGKLISQ